MRSRIRFSREYKGKNEHKDDLFDDFDDEKKRLAEEKEALYFEKYHLECLKTNSTRRNYRENLAIIELLESFISVEKESATILDIGSKNWFYAPGEYSFFMYSGYSALSCHPELVSGAYQNQDKREICLDGLEIDAFRVYADLHTRQDYALYYTQGLENCRYLPKDLMKHHEKYDYITWFYPFVTEVPILAWGLPLRLLTPLKMLKHAVSLLNPGGTMLIVNQNEREYAIQENLIKELNHSYIKKGEFDNAFLQDDRKKFVTLIN